MVYKETQQEIRDYFKYKETQILMIKLKLQNGDGDSLVDSVDYWYFSRHGVVALLKT